MAAWRTSRVFFSEARCTGLAGGVGARRASLQHHTRGGRAGLWRPRGRRRFIRHPSGERAASGLGQVAPKELALDPVAGHHEAVAQGYLRWQRRQCRRRWGGAQGRLAGPAVRRAPRKTLDAAAAAGGRRAPRTHLAPGLEAAPGEAHDPALEGGKGVGGGQGEDGLIYAHVPAMRGQAARRVGGRWTEMHAAGVRARSGGAASRRARRRAPASGRAGRQASQQARKAGKLLRYYTARTLTQRTPCGGT